MMDPAAMVTVKLRYVHQDVDRHGNVRTYFWRKGGPKVRIRESLGSQAFLDVYRGLLADSQSGKLTLARRPNNCPIPGHTVGSASSISDLLGSCVSIRAPSESAAGCWS